MRMGQTHINTGRHDCMSRLVDELLSDCAISTNALNTHKDNEIGITKGVYKCPNTSKDLHCIGFSHNPDNPDNPQNLFGWVGGRGGVKRRLTRAYPVSVSVSLW